MSVVFEQPGLWQRIRPLLRDFDRPLLTLLLALAAMGLVTMYSVGYDHGTRFVDHGRNMLIGATLLVLVAQVPPQRLMALAVPIYAVGLTLLVATALFGITKKGATRWLDVGVVIQPSEIMKLAVPLMLAWWFQRSEGQARWREFAVAGLLLVVPFALIAKQPDLGTSLLVLAGGLYVLFFAGLPWRLILPVVVVVAAAVAALVLSEDRICQPDVAWPMLRDYQKHRVCTLLDPSSDPLGKGFMSGTQTHLEFIPERTTDFVFAGLAEEFGLVGAGLLIGTFFLLILRGLWIAAQAPTLFSRLLAGAITLSLFTYAFVNLGMVCGILPVVGVPLPFISYGGTAMVTMGVSLGMLVSIGRHRALLR